MVLDARNGALAIENNTTSYVVVALTASSALTVNSTTRGFLQPRMTTTQRNAISSPATGLQVYNTTTNTNNVYDGTRWQTVNSGVTGSATLDFADTASGNYADLTITVTGAADGDVVSLGIPNASMPAGACSFTAWVSAANTVTVRFSNFSGGNLNPASGTFRAFVTK